MKIQKMVADELKRANEIHSPFFQSRHEAQAILREEVEEAKKEVSDIYNNIIFVYWTYCKNSKRVGTDSAVQLLERTKDSVNNAIAELIQVSAMLEKAKLYEKIKGNDKK